MNRLYTLAIACVLSLSASAAFAQGQTKPTQDKVASRPAQSTIIVYKGTEKTIVTVESDVKRTEWKGNLPDNKFNSVSN